MKINYNISDGVVLPLLYRPAKHIFRFITDKPYRNYHLLASRLGNTSRYQPRSIKISELTLDVPDVASFLSTYYELFVENIYAFTSTSATPKILDLGANIGLSVLYFKHLYPNAKITAYEADPDIFKYLVRNVHGNGFDDVQLINKAIWDDNGSLEFLTDGADGGRVSSNGNDNHILVDSVDIRDVLSKDDFDFLKMDIEGAEEIVFPACKNYLSNIQNVFIEYHSTINRQQFLDKILVLLAEAGFRVHLQSIMNRPSPFLGISDNASYDNQLNIFAKKI